MDGGSGRVLLGWAKGGMVEHVPGTLMRRDAEGGERTAATIHTALVLDAHPWDQTHPCGILWLYGVAVKEVTEMTGRKT